MKFNTVAEAFNFYRNFTTEELEKRATEVKGVINTNPDVDIDSINIELEAIKQAKENNNENENRAGGFKMITEMRNEVKTFNKDTVLDTAEYRSAFYKTMLGQTLNQVEAEAFKVATEVAEQRADSFNSASNSLAVLPTATLNEVVKKAGTMGGLMGEARQFNMPTKIAIPVGSAVTRADWHTEGAEVEAKNNIPTSVTFDGFEIMQVISISQKVRKMSITAFEAYLVEELTNSIVECIAYTLVNGTGVNQGTGIESGITWEAGVNAVEVASASNIAYADVVATVAKLKRGYATGAKWAMNNTTLYNVFYGMVDSNKRPIFIADPKGEAIGKVLGFDIVIDDNIADNVAYLGNYSKYLGVNIADGVAVEVSTQSSFKKGLIDFRAMCIADCKPILSEAFVKLYKAEA